MGEFNARRVTASSNALITGTTTRGSFKEICNPLFDPELRNARKNASKVSPSSALRGSYDDGETIGTSTYANPAPPRLVGRVSICTVCDTGTTRKCVSGSRTAMYRSSPVSTGSVCRS